jgi:hypothetical protein
MIDLSFVFGSISPKEMPAFQKWKPAFIPLIAAAKSPASGTLRIYRHRTNEIEKLAPFPGSLSHAISPFIATTNFLTIDNPKPVDGS